MENELTIEISGLPDETARVILALAAQRDISPNQAAIELINHAATQAEWKPALPALPAPNDYPN
jgi:hypothetical protein